MDLKEFKKRTIELGVDQNKIIEKTKSMISLIDEQDDFVKAFNKQESIEITMLNELISQWIPEDADSKNKFLLQKITRYRKRKKKPYFNPERVDDEVKEFYNKIYKENNSIKEMIKKYLQDQTEVIQLERKLEKKLNEINPYIEELFLAGKIQPDRKTIVKSLNDVAIFLGEKGFDLTYKFLKDTFLNRDGSDLGISNIKKAVAAGNKKREILKKKLSC